MSDINTIITGGQIMARNPSEFVAQSVKDFAALAVQHANVAPLETPVHGLIMGLTDDVERLDLTEEEKMMRGALMSYTNVSYSPVDSTKYNIYKNPEYGQMLKVNGTRDVKGYTFPINVYFSGYEPTGQDMRKWIAYQKETGSAAGYIKALLDGLNPVLSKQFLTEFLLGMVSKPKTLSLEYNNTILYQLNGSDSDIANFNFEDGFGAGDDNKTKIVLADNRFSTSETAGVAEALTNDKVRAIKNRLLSYGQANGMIFIAVPFSVMVHTRKYWESQNTMKWVDTGFTQDWVKNLIVNKNPVLGEGSIVPHPLYDDITFIVIPDYIWSNVYGADPRKSFGDNSTDVFHCFAFTHNTHRYIYSEPILEIVRRAEATGEGIAFGMADPAKTVQKFACKIANPFSIVAVEVLATDIKLRDKVYGASL